MKDEKDKYEPPIAMRLDLLNAGAGNGCAVGSGDFFCELGNSAEYCNSGNAGGGPT